MGFIDYEVVCAMKKILQSILLTLLTLVLVVIVVARSELKYKYESPATVPALQT